MNKQKALPYFMYLSRVKGIGAVRFNQILRKNKQLNITLKDFFHSFSKDLEPKYSFIQNSSKQAIIDYTLYIDEEKRTLEKLHEQSIELITISDKHYPKKLKDHLELSAPPILYVKGNKKLLSKRNFAIVGTRDPSKEGMDITRSTSKYFTTQQFTIISGYAKGIDLIAHKSALDSGGNTVLVLGCGMFNFEEKAILQKKVLENNISVVSEFYPTHPWHKGYLMTRNKTICGLADGVLVVEAKEGGGAFQTGIYALMMNKPVYTISFPETDIRNSGNKKLIEKGVEKVPFQSNELSVHLEKIASKLKLKKYHQGKNQYNLFEELGEKIKKYVKSDNFYPIFSLDKMPN